MSTRRTTVGLFVGLAILLMAGPLAGQVDVTRIRKPVALKVPPGTMLPVLPVALEVQIQDDEFGEKWGAEYRETDPLPYNRFRWRRGSGIELTVLAS